MGRSRKNPQNELTKVLDFLKQSYSVDPTDVLALIEESKRQKKQKEAQFLPVSILKQKKLSSLETITVYLRENKGQKFSQMQELLGRDQRVLSTTYRNAKKKWPKKIQRSSSKYHIPLHIFSNRSLSILEHIVGYLKIHYQLPNTTIATLLDKSPKTVWTVLQRRRKKEGKK